MKNCRSCSSAKALPPCRQALAHAGCVFRALWRCHMLRAGLIVAAQIAAIGFILWGLSGCYRGAPAYPAQVPVSAPVLAGQMGKDKVILTEAEKIDKVAPAAKPHTDAQRAAVAAAPASDVAALVKLWEALKAQDDETIADLRKQVADLKDVELKKQTAWLRWFGLGAFAVAGLLAWARQFQFAAAGALAGLLALGLAQLVSQPWFMPAVTATCGLALLALGWAAFHAYRKGDLARKTEAEAERLKSTLTTLVPTLDGALESIDGAAKQTVRAALSRLMDSDHKALIHEVRATVAARKV